MISLFSSSCPIVVKQCSFSLGAMNEAEVLDVVMLSILSVKKLINVSLLNCEGIFRSGDICLFVNLATVLNKTWIVLVIIYKFVDMVVLAAFRACL